MRHVCAVGILFVIVAIVGCGQPSETVVSPEEGASAPAAKVAYETQCATCHPLTKVEEHKADAEPWADVVQEMIDAHGAAIEPNEATQIVAYLDKTYPKP